MAFGYPELVKSSDDVQLCVEFRVAEGVEGFADERERVTVFDSDGVQSTVVLADPDSASWFGGEQEGCSASRARFANEPFVEVVVEPFSDNEELSWR